MPDRFWNELNVEKDVFFQSVTQEYSEKENPSSPNRSQAFRLLVRMLNHWATGDLLKLGPVNWVHLANILDMDMNLDEWNMRNERMDKYYYF